MHYIFIKLHFYNSIFYIKTILIIKNRIITRRIFNLTKFFMIHTIDHVSLYFVFFRYCYNVVLQMSRYNLYDTELEKLPHVI